MARAYECIVHPEFYRQIGTDIPAAINEGVELVKVYTENGRRIDVKHREQGKQGKRIYEHTKEERAYASSQGSVRSNNNHVAILINHLDKTRRKALWEPEI